MELTDDLDCRVSHCEELVDIVSIISSSPDSKGT